MYKNIHLLHKRRNVTKICFMVYLIYINIWLFVFYDLHFRIFFLFLYVWLKFRRKKKKRKKKKDSKEMQLFS